jgi:hypothetical protein
VPLPLPELDTRRWGDLSEEGRALIPRYAPGWTDHNVHDPGITLIDLLSWLIEQDIYRVNRIPERHRRKFLQLLGFPPIPPRPARTALALTLAPAASTLSLPAGTTFAATGPDQQPIPFRLLQPISVVAAALVAVGSFDGSSFVDLTRAWQEGLPVAPWGTNAAPGTEPDSDPAFYLVWDQALPPGLPVSLWLRFQGPATDRGERERILAEAIDAVQPCPPVVSTTTCPPDISPSSPWCPPDPQQPVPPEVEPPGLPPHHAIRTVWEYHDAGGWHSLDPDAGDVWDDTRGFTLDGSVVLSLPAPMDQVAVGPWPAAFRIRCRLTAGPPDAAPVLLEVSANAVEVEQATPVRATLAIAPGVQPPMGQEPVPGAAAKLSLSFDQDGTVTALAADPSLDVPEVLVLAYQPAGQTEAGSIMATLAPLGAGTGEPLQAFPLPGAPVSSGMASLWTVGTLGERIWELRPDLDASTRLDAHVVLDLTAGMVTVGDGERGQVVESGNFVLVTHDVTAAADGNISAGSAFQLAGADDAVNAALLGQDPSAVAALLAGVSNRGPASGGAAEENLDTLAGRAASALWAHERLLDLCPVRICDTLDQIDRASVLALSAPERASTLLDFERLAVDVPGTRVARARAWAGMDPSYPGLWADGTVTVVVVPFLPGGEPQPHGLLSAVRRYLDRRRVVCTRLLVVGPEYLEVSVRATVTVKAAADRSRVQAGVTAALNAFLDPLTGGPAALGWPFGRDVYRSEILQVIDGVGGVDHVTTLELVPGTGAADCGNVCVGPASLVCPGTHLIQIG